MAPIEEKLTQHRLRWFGHVQRRPPEAPVRSGVLKRVDKVKRSRGRPKLTWDESVKRDLKDWDISEELVLDRSAWRLAINVAEPWPLCLLGFISSLSQLAWDKKTMLLLLLLDATRVWVLVASGSHIPAQIICRHYSALICKYPTMFSFTSYTESLTS